MLSSLPLSKFLRLGSALLLLACAFAAGFDLRSPWYIGLLAIAFSAGYIAGKWHLWRRWRSQTISTLITQLLSIYLIQVVLVGVLYLLGAGLANILGRSGVSVLTISDFWFPSIVMLITLSCCVLINHLEAKDTEGATLLADQHNSAIQPEIELLDTVITPQTFFSATHYSHGSAEQGLGSESKIAQAERLLQHALPESLKVLYRIQNGGSLPILVIYKKGRKATGRSDDVVYPFGGYNDLLPLENLRSLHDFFSDFADPDEEAERFPEGCEQQIVLAAWYRNILLLDYNALDTAGEPGVLFADFDDDNWRERAERWPNFASFFALLREVRD
jgi:SMI1 / KNR4 family (SUKH-1)